MKILPKNLRNDTTLIGKLLKNGIFGKFFYLPLPTILGTERLIR